MVYFWQNDEKRLIAAKRLLEFRIDFIKKTWFSKSQVFDEGYCFESAALLSSLEQYRSDIQSAVTIMEIFSVEARFTKQLYKMVCEAVNYLIYTCKTRAWKRSGE